MSPLLFEYNKLKNIKKLIIILATSRVGCIDDLRISERSVPLPPAVNSSAWGQVGGFQGVEAGCDAPSACANVTCSPPLSCVDTWRAYHCG